MEQRGQDPNQPYDEQPGSYEPTRRRSGSQGPQDGVPQYGGQDPYAGQAPYAPGPQQYQRPCYPQPPQAPKKKRGAQIAGFGCLGIVALIVIIVIAAAVGGSKTGNTAAGSTTTPPAPVAVVTTVAGQGVIADASTDAVAPATSAAPAVPDQVAFSCTGSAPDGIDITYGSDSSNSSASHLPFHKTIPVASDAEYYDITAQLSGSGHVTCSTSVRQDGSSVSKSGTAEGGYNIATAEVCSDFTGGWESC